MNQYQNVLKEIAAAAKGCSRDPSNIRLIAVTKTVDWEKVLPLYEAGQRDFGENRVVDALEKKGSAPDDCRWHLIGTLQSNKVRKVVGNFVLIHSVDSVELAKKISDVSLEQGIVTEVLLQANVSGEGTKHGLSAGEWMEHFHEVLAFPGIQVKGLMTMAPETDDKEIIRNCFSELRLLRDALQTRFPTADLRELSMGMSSDFKIAIEEGATLLRIGSALWK